VSLTPILLRAVAVVVLASLANPVLGVGPARADQQRDSQWYLKSLRLAEAHAISKGAGVTVAVVDTGVRADHPDLRGAVLSGFNALGSGDGREDVRGHGTAMAGIIAARGRAGGRGVLGMAPAAKILPVGPATSPLVVTDAIKWSVEHGAKVINLSIGVLEDEGLAAVVKEAAVADVVLVAATGNDGEEGIKGDFPAAYPEVVAVGATDRAGMAASFSRRGPQLDLVAPGVDITVANGEAGGDYSVVEGTSTSTAIVSGAAALIRAKYPELSAADVVRILESTASDKGAAGRDDTYGHGELNLVAALEAAAAAEPSQKASAESSRAGVIAGSGSDDESLPRLVIVAFGVLVLAGAVLALVVGVRRR
jgi:type VII secretion-associated serine protease mycosin